ncbi:MAG: sigma-70 family RNA polymerase sigma factor [Firmicutes bacterium]|nr:sigma-70 family RNA polymerase sigma factor [Bacillota bacterium]
MYESERELVMKAREGDTAAFGLLAQRYGQRVYATVLLLVRSHQDAEDIVQEAFLKALNNLRQFRQEASFGTWLQRIAYNLAYDFLRRRREIPGSDLLTIVAPIDSGIPNTLDRLELLGALETLPPEMRAVLVLRHGEDLSIQEIAATLKIPAGTVKSRLYNGYRRLRAELKRLREEQE